MQGPPLRLLPSFIRFGGRHGKAREGVDGRWVGCEDRGEVWVADANLVSPFHVRGGPRWKRSTLTTSTGGFGEKPNPAATRRCCTGRSSKAASVGETPGT